MLYPDYKRGTRIYLRIEFKLQKPKEEWREQENEPDVVGKALIYFDQKQIKEVPLYYKTNKIKREKSFLEYFRNLFHSYGCEAKWLILFGYC